MQKLSALFYAYNGLLVPPCPDSFQEALYILTCLFNMVVLQNNVEKMVGMILQL